MLNTNEWQQLAEMEAVAKVITDVTTLVQTEACQMGAMGYALHCRLLDSLRQPAFDVLDLASITADNSRHPPRKSVEVEAMTAIGKQYVSHLPGAQPHPPHF